MKLFDDLIESSAKFADQAAKVAGEVMDKGKRKVSKLAVENDFAKAQRQLGALVYVMHKTGEQNEELLSQYIDDVAKLEAQLAEFKEEEPTRPGDNFEMKVCPNCGGVITDGDMFCRGCGTKIG
ncbi:MAG: zinc ribbon domain-containing protein [Oscillospiraceae bacterium]